jgi:crotonobetainyl-CoA:carnitine CoA-transferase CaiB-like acyl-CoA transferase
MLPYRTADDRWVALMVLSPDQHWRPLCALLGRQGLADDPRFADAGARRTHARACVEALEAAFAEQPLAVWRRRLAGFAGEWAVVQEPAELADDPQVQANGYLTDVPMGLGEGDVRVPMVTSPVQYDEQPGRPTRAPEPGEHTEEVLLELGLTWPEIGDLKDRGAIT